jgi:hypothetical protein
MEELTKYTGRFQALWDNYFWAKEQIEHRKNTIGMEETPEEKAMRLDYMEWAKKQPWNQEEVTTNE